MAETVRAQRPISAASPASDLAAMRRRAVRDPLQRALFGDPISPEIVAERAALCDELAPIYHQTMQDLGVDMPSGSFLFDFVVPLVQYFRPRVADASRPYLIALGGGPGVGKTTLSGVLAACLNHMVSPDGGSLSLSLDDFYHSREERQRRGHKWRTLPGSHDTARLRSFTRELDQGIGPFTVPRYSLGRDEPLPDDVLPAPPGLCVFDGAMVGANAPGYDRLARRIDFLIFLDAPIEQLKSWRFGREQKIRQKTNGRAGFTETQMQAFWDEALEPSVTQWVLPNAAIADMVVRIDADRRVLDARRRDVNASAAEMR